MTVVWTDGAKADLRAVGAGLAQSSPRAARDLSLRIARKTLVLADHPRFGAVVPEYDEDDSPELLEHPYRMYPDRVEIVMVIHSARRLPKGL